MEEEYVQVKKEFLDEIKSFLKDSAYEGNCFAQAIIQKYNIE